MKLAVAALVVTGLAIGCGGGRGKPPALSAKLEYPETQAEKLLALLPPGAQLVVEVDLARLRANPVVGALVTKLVTGTPLDLPGDISGSPLAVAELVILAAYGVGTANAATISLVASKQPIPDATEIGDGLYALGPTEWVGLVEQRRILALASTPIHAAPELLRLRDRAMPERAPGASLRITARLPFDARVALARQTGLESAPAQLSIWADVVDDFVIIIDADAADPGERKAKRAIARLETMIRAALRVLADAPEARVLGLTSSLARARMIKQGTWIRTIVAVGPAHLQRVVTRATVVLDARPTEKPTEKPAAPPPPPPEPTPIPARAPAQPHAGTPPS